MNATKQSSRFQGKIRAKRKIVAGGGLWQHYALTFALSLMPDTCYMCDKAATSVEHVPPRSLFPKKKDLDAGHDLRKQLITVPSCDVHNTSKSHDDEYLMYVLVMNIPNNETANNYFRNKVMRAIERNPGIINRLLRNHISVKTLDTSNNTAANTIALEIERERVVKSLELIGYALYYHHYRKHWQGTVQAIPHFLLTIDTPDDVQDNARIARLEANMIEMMNLRPEPVLGENPRVFSYQMSPGQGDIDTCMLLRFYEGSRATLLFRPPVGVSANA